MMSSKAGQNPEEDSVRFTVGGAIGEVIEWPEVRVGAEHIRQTGQLPQTSKNGTSST